MQIQPHSSCIGDGFTSCCEYKGLGGKIIRNFKYKRQFDLLVLISAAIAEAILPVGGSEMKVIIPVPQSWRKTFIRGFHPVEMICKQVGAFTEIPVQYNLLKRKFEWVEKDQASLSKQERVKNLSHSFVSIRKESLKGKREVFLIDDVATTGKTLFMCKQALLENYPEWTINSLVFAHG